jgi:platelet-activating factor acetylhydrolase
MSSPSFIRRKTTRITGDEPDQRRNSISSQQPAGKVPHARKPRSRPPSSLRDHLPFPQSTLAPSSGPYSVSSMDIEVPAEHPRPISDITRNGRHVLQLETVLFTLYYPAAFGTGQGPDPSGSKHWSRETWLPRPRRETARGYARFANIPDWSAIAVFGATSMLTKLRGFRNGSLATHWPPDGNSKRNGYTIKNKHGPPPPGHGPEPVFPLLLFSHGLGGTRTAYSSLCSEFASYGFVVCAVEHRDGSGPRTFVNHCKRNTKDKDDGGDTTPDQADAGQGTDSQQERERWKNVDHSEDDIRKGYHHVVRNYLLLR